VLGEDGPRNVKRSGGEGHGCDYFRKGGVTIVQIHENRRFHDVIIVTSRAAPRPEPVVTFVGLYAVCKRYQ